MAEMRYNERNLPGYGDQQTWPACSGHLNDPRTEDDMKLAHNHVSTPEEHVEYWLYEQACKELARAQTEVRTQKDMLREVAIEYGKLIRAYKSLKDAVRAFIAEPDTANRNTVEYLMESEGPE